MIRNPSRRVFVGSAAGLLAGVAARPGFAAAASERPPAVRLGLCTYSLYKTPFPQVIEAAVVARPDATWGEHPCAFVTLKAGSAPVAEADIIAFCRAHMAHFKVPRTVVFGPLPKTSTGKIQKFILRDRAKAEKSHVTNSGNSLGYRPVIASTRSTMAPASPR